MEQLARIWRSLTTAQRASLIAAPAIVCALLFGFIKWKHDSEFRTLYTALAPEDASAVTQKIRESGIEYRLDETGSTVLVNASQLAEARLALAGAGLPRTGRIGFELFDKANLGVSDFAEQVNYRRALEGELERTVSTLAEIEQARIHLTFAKDSVFLDAKQPAKATVVLRLKRVSGIQQSNVTAIANLVASAVDGLAPESVAIVDGQGRLLNRPRATEDGEAKLAESNLDYRHQLESELLSRINTSLEPLLGAGHFRAGLNAECDFTSTEESDESFDPAKSAILSSQTTEESTSTGLNSGTPGTAANLPQPPPRSASASGGLSRRTQNVSYQPGKTVRHTISPKGTLRRISTAVLIDQTVRWDGSGAKRHKVLIPASAEVIKAAHDIIASITGFSEQRGDQITVETVPFESTLSAEPPSAAAPVSTPTAPLVKQPLAIGLVAVAFLFALAIVFMLKRKPALREAVSTEAAITAASGMTEQRPATATALPVNAGLEKQMADNQAEQEQVEAEALGRIKLPANTRKTEVLVKHIREAVQKDPLNAANVLRTWVSDIDTRRST